MTPISEPPEAERLHLLFLAKLGVPMQGCYIPHAIWFSCTPAAILEHPEEYPDHSVHLAPWLKSNH